MQAEIKGNNLVITIPCDTKNLMPSSSGKSLIVASTHGNQPTSLQVNGKPLVVSVNAYVKA